MGNVVDKQQLTDHIETCISLSERKGEQKVANVLRNLKKEIEDDEFASREQNE